MVCRVYLWRTIIVSELLRHTKPSESPNASTWQHWIARQQCHELVFFVYSRLDKHSCWYSKNKPPIWEWFIPTISNYLWWFEGWFIIVIPTLIPFPDHPWCWNIFLHRNPYLWPSFVGKYTSTMDDLGLVLLQDSVFFHIRQSPPSLQGQRELDDYVVVEGGRWGGGPGLQLEQL